MEAGKRDCLQSTRDLSDTAHTSARVLSTLNATSCYLRVSDVFSKNTEEKLLTEKNTPGNLKVNGEAKKCGHGVTCRLPA